MEWMVKLVWFYLFWTDVTACLDELSFQSSPSYLSTILEARPLDIPKFVKDAWECAGLCYGTEKCHSAIYSPNDLNPNQKYSTNSQEKRVKGRGVCTLFPTAPVCDSDTRHSEDDVKIYSTPVLLYCFVCSSSIREEIRPPLVWKESNGNKSVGMEETRRSRPRKKRRTRSYTLRVMTFNTFLCGSMVDSGIFKLSKHIQMYDPDVVFLQEVSDDSIGALMANLGPKWRACSRNSGRLNHVITQRRITGEFPPGPVLYNNACQIQLDPPNDNFVLNLWNVHLNPRNYAPYRACSLTKPIRSMAELDKCERDDPGGNQGISRVQEILTLSRHQPFQDVLARAGAPGGTPLILAGDFNAPSHLDWTDRAKGVHCQMSFDWPTSKMMEEMGFKDSYREIKRDPYFMPGATWSTIYKNSTTEFVNGFPMPEPQDRIDFIYYKGGRIKVMDSFVYTGYENIFHFPFYSQNDWPSDHAAVITTFELTDV